MRQMVEPEMVASKHKPARTDAANVKTAFVLTHTLCIKVRYPFKASWSYASRLAVSNP